MRHRMRIPDGGGQDASDCSGVRTLAFNPGGSYLDSLWPPVFSRETGQGWGSHAPEAWQGAVSDLLILRPHWGAACQTQSPASLYPPHC